MNIKRLLSKLVSIDSSYPNERNISDFLYNHLVKNGFNVEKHYITSNRYNVLASKGSGNKSVLFYGHVDTVSPVTPELWRNPPHKLTEKLGKLYGLGAFDMKSGIVAILTACQKTDRYVKIFFAVDEENISEGAWKAVDEKREFFQDVELIISPEPNFAGGLNTINRGRSGRCIFEMEFKGKAKHIAEFQHATDSVELLGNFIAKLYGTRMSLFNEKGCVVQIRKISAESIGMSVCSRVNILVEALIGIGGTIDDVHDWLMNIAGDTKITLKERETPYLTSYSFNDFPHSDTISEVIEQITGSKVKLTVRNSVGDDNVFAQIGIPVINIGPDGGNAHGIDEFVTEASLIKLIEIFDSFLRKQG